MGKLDRLGWAVSSSFDIGDVRLAIRSTSPAFGAWLSDVLIAYEVDDVEEYLYSVVMPEPPADGRPKEFCILYKGSAAILRTLDPVTLGRGLLAELEGLGFHQREDALYMIASIVDVNGVPALVPSQIVPGLARLGRRAAKLGVGIPGEQTVCIDVETASVVPIRKSLEVPTDALERLAVACPWQGRDGLRFVQGPEVVQAILVPARDPETQWQQSRKGYTLANLAGWTLNLEKVGGRGLEALGRFVQQAQCYESVLSDVAESMELFAGELKPQGQGEGS